MRKTFFCFIFAFLVMFVGCSDKPQNDPQTEKELNSAIEAVNRETRLSGKYTLEYSFGENVAFYYASGDIDWDREQECLSTVFDQTYLGMSSKAANYYSNGKMVTVDDGEAITLDCTPEELFTKFPYCTVDPFSSEYGELSVSDNAKGKVYSFKRKDTKALYEKLVGGDIYELVAVLKKPQKDKTEYGEAECLFTVADEKLVSCRYEFDMKLFDTPSVVEGYTPPEEEYTIKLHISAKVVYEDFGDAVEIKKYSA